MISEGAERCSNEKCDENGAENVKKELRVKKRSTEGELRILRQ